MSGFAMKKMNTIASTNSIDPRSYILGMNTAFAECVTNESKKLALSPPFYPTDYNAVINETNAIAEDQAIFLWYEKNLDIRENQRLNWFVLYKFPEVLDEYRHLRNEGYNPAWNFEKFSDLLSYGAAWGTGAAGVVPKMKDRKTTRDTYARILLKPGDWPIPRP
jgi:hypothetical protein